MIPYNCHYCQAPVESDNTNRFECNKHSDVSVKYEGFIHYLYNGTLEVIVEVQYFIFKINEMRYMMVFNNLTEKFYLSYRNGSGQNKTILKLDYIPTMLPEQAIEKCKTMMTFL